MKPGNEQVKLQATFFNNLAVGSYIAGAVASAVPFYQSFPVVDILLRGGVCRRCPTIYGPLFSWQYGASEWQLSFSILRNGSSLR